LPFHFSADWLLRPWLANRAEVRLNQIQHPIANRWILVELDVNALTPKLNRPIAAACVGIMARDIEKLPSGKESLMLNGLA